MQWFRSKWGGWGWYPVTWQGWVIQLFFVVLATLEFLRLDSLSHSISDTLVAYIPEAVLLVVINTGVGYLFGRGREIK